MSWSVPKPATRGPGGLTCEHRSEGNGACEGCELLLLREENAEQVTHMHRMLALIGRALDGHHVSKEYGGNAPEDIQGLLDKAFVMGEEYKSRAASLKLARENKDRVRAERDALREELQRAYESLHNNAELRKDAESQLAALREEAARLRKKLEELITCVAHAARDQARLAESYGIAAQREED